MSVAPPISRYRRWAFAVARSKQVRLLAGPKVFGRADRWLLGHTGGRHSLTGAAGLPSMLLTTTGRRTGELRTVALLYVADGGDLVVVASNWARDGHPSWSENLLADPRAQVACRAGRFGVRTRLCGEEERRRRWPALVAAMPLWRDYEQLTPRELRVFVLERG